MTNYELLAGLMPEAVAARQAAWERRAQAARAWNAGATYAHIACKMGLSTTRVMEIVGKAMRERDKPSPAEAYQRPPSWQSPLQQAMQPPAPQQPQ